MALRYEPAGGIDHNSSAIRDIFVSHELMSLSLLAESETFEKNEFVAGEAIMELAHLNILDRLLGFVESSLHCLFSHAKAY